MAESRIDGVSRAQRRMSEACCAVVQLGSMKLGEYDSLARRRAHATYHALEDIMTNEKGPNVKKKPKCKNCEGKGTLKKGDKVVKCQRCGGSGLR
jgi:hypothetical protein